MRLKFRRLAIVFALLCTAALSSTAAEQEYTLAEVLANYQAALGGAEAIRSVDTVIVEGRSTDINGGSAMPFKAWYRPKRKQMRLDYMFAGVPGSIAYDGRNGWSIPPMVNSRRPLPLTGLDLANIREQADFFGPLINSGKKNVELKLLPPETRDGREMQRVEVRRMHNVPAPPGDGRERKADRRDRKRRDSAGDESGEPAETLSEEAVWMLDSETWQLVEVHSSSTDAGGETRDIRVLYGDYRPAGPIVWPHRVETHFPDGQGDQVNILESVRINESLEGVRFDLARESQEAALQ